MTAALAATLTLAACGQAESRTIRASDYGNDWPYTLRAHR
jgi:hypothetical protein